MNVISNFHGNLSTGLLDLLVMKTPFWPDGWCNRPDGGLSKTQRSHSVGRKDVLSHIHILRFLSNKCPLSTGTTQRFGQSTEWQQLVSNPASTYWTTLFRTKVWRGVHTVYWQMKQTSLDPGGASGAKILECLETEIKKKGETVKQRKKQWLSACEGGGHCKEQLTFNSYLVTKIRQTTTWLGL